MLLRRWRKKSVGSVDPRIGLISAFEPARTVTTRLIQDHRYVRSRSDKLAITTLYHVTIGLLCFYHQQDLIHERGQTDSWAGLVNWRHIENDVVEIAGLEIWYQGEELFESKMRGFVPGSVDCCQVKIIGSGSDRRLRFNGRSERGSRAAGKEWMNFTIGSIHIDKKNLTITGFREGGSNAGSESRSSRAFAKAGNADQLRFMSNSM